MNKKTLVIGASLNPSRYSNFVVQKLIALGHEVVAIGKKSGEIASVKINTEQLPYKDLDTVTLYINPENQKGFYDYIVSLKPKRVIFNPGTENPELYQILKNNNIPFEIACSLVLLSTNQY
ncbi:CoA-binding protein [Confluentibacter flavum]|uniref:CoA-binding protein n=1 Tax=Confluentibacter flavum TaxID=1909700 RepID=A0A2N3HPV5_9FLAO|nr:CoA-binding protein [Confluentibacter flavum]PKQ46952.1 CoA-binding protein [Confluentibacter flavum]